MLDSHDKAEVHGLAVNLASRSDHPVSRAVALAAQDTVIQNVSDFEALAGRGTKGIINGQQYHLGNHRLVHELGWCSPELETQLFALEQQGKTVILLANETGVLALFAVADTVKNSSRQAIASCMIWVSKPSC